MWSWRTTQDGFVEVDQGSGFERISLPGPDEWTAKTKTWLPIARKYAEQFGVPISWALGVIYSESGGNPTVRNACCAGLMALALSVYRITEAEAFDPEINIKLGVQTLGNHRSKGFDLPATASMYNAGPSAVTGGPKTSSSDPWGMAENRPAVPWTGYIEKVVRANNWWLEKELSGELDVPMKMPPLPATSPALPVIAGVATGWLLVANWRKLF